MSSVLTARPANPGPPSRRQRSWLVPVVIATVLAGSTVLATVTRTARHRIPAPSLAIGTVVDEELPQIPLVGSDGRPTSLTALRGKTVIVADFLTSCQEECPITTGALEAVRSAVAAAGLSEQIAIVEVSIDPGRDSPARLRAYAVRAGVGLTLMTGTPGNLAALWRFLGVFVQRTPEGSPPGLDWQTGRPYAYDVAHQDGVFFLSANGRERFVIGGDASVGGTLAAPLASLLDPVGQAKLRAPQPGAWTTAQVLQVLHWLTGRKL